MAHPPGPEGDLLRILDRLQQEGAAAKSRFADRVEKNLKLKRGNQWRLKGRKPHFLYNVIDDSIERKVDKVTETKPLVRVMPAKNGLDDAAQILHRCVSAIWDERKSEDRIEQLGFWGALSGVAFVGTPFNLELDFGEGDPDFTVRDPRSISFDPAVVHAPDLDSAEYLIIEDSLALDIIRYRYPGRGAEVKPGASELLSPQGEDSEQAISSPERMPLRSERRLDAVPRARITEYWVKDRRRDLSDSGFLPVIPGVTQAAERGAPFPGGRWIIRAGDVILSDRYNPYWDGRFPWDCMTWRFDPERVWGDDDVQSIEVLQNALNRLGDAFIGVALRNAIETIVADADALDPDEWAKLEGRGDIDIIKTRPQRAFNRSIPQFLPEYAVIFINRLIELAQQRVGVAESAISKRVPSIVTGPAIEGLQLQIETVIRSVARRLETLLESVGQKHIARVFQYWTADRVIQLVDPGGKWMSFEFERRKILLDSQGEPRSPEDIRKAFRDFRFKVEPGSSLAISKVQRGMGKAYFAEKGVYPWEEVLEEFGIQNAREKIQKAQAELQSGLIQSPQGDGRREKQQNPFGNLGL